VNNPGLTKAMNPLISANVELHHGTMHVKPSETGHPLPMHQDWPFYKHRDGRFLDVIVTSRPTYASAVELNTVADGRIYTADQALKLAVIDAIDYLSAAIDNVMLAADVSDADVVTYIRGKSRDTNIYSQLLSPSGLQINMINLDAGALFGGGSDRILLSMAAGKLKDIKWLNR